MCFRIWLILRKQFSHDFFKYTVVSLYFPVILKMYLVTSIANWQILISGFLHDKTSYKIRQNLSYQGAFFSCFKFVNYIYLLICLKGDCSHPWCASEGPKTICSTGPFLLPRVLGIKLSLSWLAACALSLWTTCVAVLLWWILTYISSQLWKYDVS